MWVIIGCLLIIYWLFWSFLLIQRPIWDNRKSSPVKLNIMEQRLLEKAEDDIFFYLIQCNRTMNEYAKEHMPERLTKNSQ